MIAKYMGRLRSLLAAAGRYRPHGWVLGSALLAALLWRYSPLERLEWFAFDARLRLRQEHGWPKDLVLIRIDDEATGEIGPWPWPRTRQKELLDRVRALGAKTILYDVFLSAPGNPSEDNALAGSLGNVTLGIPLSPVGRDRAAPPSLLTALVDLPAPAPYGLDRLAVPQEVFASRAAGIGHSVIFPQQDGRVRGNVPLLGIAGLHGALPSLPLVAFLHQRGFRPQDLRLTEGKLLLPNGVALPLHGGETYLDFVRPEMFDLPVIPARALFHDPESLRSRIEGNLALIYLDTVYVNDKKNTPVASLIPGGLLLASALRGFDQGHLPEPVSSTACYLGVLAAGLLLCSRASRWTPLRIAEAGGIAVVLVVGLACAPVPLFDLFPPLVLPLSFVLLSTVGLTLGSLRSIEGERSQLAELLQLARKQGSGSSHQAVEQLAVTDRARKGQASAALNPEPVPARKLANGGLGAGGSADPVAQRTRASGVSAASRPSAALLLGGQALEEDYEFGRYLVKSALGQGGMGAIFLAIDKDLQRPVALKVLSSADKAAFERFRREAMAVARLSHPNVVQIYEVNLDPKAPYIVMEYVGGGTLGDILRDPDEPLPMDWRRASRIVMGAAAGLGAAHQRGIVHRDVKPANLLMTQRGGDVVKVSDFGIAKLGGEERLTQEGSFVGTIGYLSPEQALGKEVDARSDVYALALTWYRLLTGQRAFDGTTAQILRTTVSQPVPDPTEVNPQVPSQVAELLIRMGDLDRDRRPRNGAVVADAIRSLLA